MNLQQGKTSSANRIRNTKLPTSYNKIGSKYTKTACARKKLLISK